MCPIEMFAELVTYKIDFDNKLQIATFCNELQQTLLENYFDDDYTPTTSSSEDEHDDAIKEEDVKVVKDKEGFQKLVWTKKPPKKNHS